MKIKLEKRDNLYYADLLDLPGSPPTGRGETKHEAIANLFFMITSNSKWNWYIDHNEFKIIEPKQPLYVRIHLSLDCVMELKLTGEVTQEAFNRLLEFLKVTGEVWGLQVERQEEIID